MGTITRATILTVIFVLSAGAQEAPKVRLADACVVPAGHFGILMPSGSCTEFRNQQKKQHWRPKFREVADSAFWRHVALNTATGAFNLWARQRAVHRNPQLAEAVPLFGKRPSVGKVIGITAAVHVGTAVGTYWYKSLEMRQDYRYGSHNDGLPPWHWLPHALDAAHIAAGIHDLTLAHRPNCPSGTVCP